MSLLALTIDDPNGNPFPIRPPVGMPSGGFGNDGNGTANIILRYGIIILFVAAIILALFFFIWGGISWITSGGDKTKVQAARNKMVYSIIGLIIVFLAFFIVSVVGSLFGVSFFQGTLSNSLHSCAQFEVSFNQGKRTCTCDTPLHETVVDSQADTRVCNPPNYK